jgi:hypothetical protein
MGSSKHEPDERVRDVRFGDDTLSVDLVDGRTITAPLTWFPRLLRASLEERAHWTISAGGFGVHWPDVDEDLSTAGLLHGVAPSPADRPDR